MSDFTPISGWLCRSVVGRIVLVLLWPVVFSIEAMLMYGSLFSCWIIGGNDRLRDKGWIP